MAKHPWNLQLVSGACVLILTLSARAETIVQTGSLAGTVGGPTEHNIVLDQFDDMDGTRLLVGITIEALTSVVGGFETTGSGQPVDIYAALDVDYFLDSVLLLDTLAVVDNTVTDSFPPIAVSVFDTDPQETIIPHPGLFLPWIGDGTIRLTAVTEFTQSEDPAGLIGFGAGGSANYTVTYDYIIVKSPCPEDLDGSGDVAFNDLLQLLAAWGACEACAEDLDGSGDVGFADLLQLLAAWGACS